MTPQNPPFTASHQDKPANVVSNRLMSSAPPSTSRRTAASARAQTKQTTWQVKVGPFAVGPSRLLEACSQHDYSTAHGAYLTGVAAAEQVIAARRGQRS